MVTPAEPLESRRYLRNDADSGHVGLGVCAARPCLGAGRLLAPVAVVEAVRRLEGCKTLAAHARSLGAGGPGAEDDHRRRLLSAAVDHRLLISEQELLDELRARPAPPAAGISALVVLTRDRPALLRRCLESYAGNLTEHGRSPPVVVLDDSRAESAVLENRASAERCSRRHGLPVEHFGPDEARAFARQLERRADVPPDLIAFALFGPPGCPHLLGANRNRMSLRTAGGRLIAVDDDTVCELHAPQEAGGWALESQPDEETWFFEDRAAARHQWPAVARDWVGLFEPVVGAAVAGLLAAAGSITARTLRPATLAAALQPGARVRYAGPGLVGDCAGRAPHVLSVTGPARERLRSDQAYQQLACRTREVARTVERLTLSPPSWCMGYALGLDNAGPLPPFFPGFRNSDGLFAKTLSACDPAAFRAELPCALFHDPAETRTFGAIDHLDACTTHGVSDLLEVAVHLAIPAAQAQHDPARRMRTIGAFLERLAAGSPRELAAVITDSLRYRWSALAAHLDALRVPDGRSGDWGRDLERAIRRLHAAIRSDDPLCPIDLADGTQAERLATLQGLVGAFGRLLIDWEALSCAAIELRSVSR